MVGCANSARLTFAQQTPPSGGVFKDLLCILTERALWYTNGHVHGTTI